MKRLIMYIILVAASMYMALIYRSEAFLNIFYGGIFILLILTILNIISICGMDVSINIPEKFVQAGRKIPVRIVLNNKTILPTGNPGCGVGHTVVALPLVFPRESDRGCAEVVIAQILAARR